MSDIVDRLRSVSGCTQKTYLHRLDWDEGRQIIAEAADEIDRLWKALKKIEYASRKDSLTDAERLESVRTVVCAALGAVGGK